jgi:LmbE family N-acetylglucosaminyl deacetylase
MSVDALGRSSGQQAGMIALPLPAPKSRALRVLCLGAHCDDIEIGCGGTLLQLQRQHRRLCIDWAVFSGNAVRRAETTAAMKRLIAPAARGALTFGDFPDARFPTAYDGLKQSFRTLAARPAPDLVFTHFRDDAHQDHRVINEMTWGGFRNHLILEYEIPKWDGDLQTPQVYVPLSKAQVARKVATLMAVYGSQRSRDWFTPDTFEAIMRLRGIESRARSGFAEGFYIRKLTLLGG